jgi:5-methylcytosine-specific restriction enzyme subunit McrC
LPTSPLPTPTRSSAGSHLDSTLGCLHLAEVIIAGSSFEPGGTGLNVSGFVINMAKVFEDFVCETLGEQLRAVEGTTQTQDTWHLDRDNTVAMRPDLVWYGDDDLPTAVIDAKYKAERPDGFRTPTCTNCSRIAPRYNCPSDILSTRRATTPATRTTSRTPT